MKLTKNRYLQVFSVVVLALAMLRLVYPQVAEGEQKQTLVTETMNPSTEENNDATEQHAVETTEQTTPQTVQVATESVTKTDFSPTIPQRGASGKPHRIFSVPSYDKAFPDSNALQLTAAQRWGVSPVRDRTDAEKRKKELVYVAASPYYHVDPLRQSIPYLVPRAAVLLQDIGQAFFDSLYVKGVPLHRIIVTSVLRSQEDVSRLRRHNGNATENSCHLYGTTFDICYNRYKTVEDPDGPKRYEVRNDTLKFVLSEVLRDMRNNHRCYIKYEKKQGCFHMTVR
jgi:hypothetical protein